MRIYSVSNQQRLCAEGRVEFWTGDPMNAKHPGFKAVQKKIAKRSGVSKKAAGAILASATRKASKKAKKKNPRLKRVK